jgi:hypothetical protein
MQIEFKLQCKFELWKITSSSLFGLSSSLSGPTSLLSKSWKRIFNHKDVSWNLNCEKLPRRSLDSLPDCPGQNHYFRNPEKEFLIIRMSVEIWIVRNYLVVFIGTLFLVVHWTHFLIVRAKITTFKILKKKFLKFFNHKDVSWNLNCIFAINSTRTKTIIFFQIHPKNLLKKVRPLNNFLMLSIFLLEQVYIFWKLRKQTYWK